MLSSYFLTIAILIHRRLFGAALPSRRWTLGKWGLAANLMALAFLTPVVFFDFWPLYRDVTAENLNWGPVMFVGVLLVSMAYFLLKARKEYVGPVMKVRRDE